MFKGMHMQYTCSLVICEFLLSYHDFTGQKNFFKSLGNKIEPALMVLLLKWGDPFKSNAKSQSIASLKSEGACTGAIAFGEVLRMPFLLLPALHYFQNAFTIFNLLVFHKNPVCVLEAGDYNSHL